MIRAGSRQTGMWQPANSHTINLSERSVLGSKNVLVRYKN